MTTLPRRSIRRSSMLEAASSSTMPLDLPGRQPIANGRHVGGSRGRHQLTTPPSASSWQPPFVTSSAAILSGHGGTHDSHSTRCMECWAKTLASRSFKSACSCLAPHASGDRSCHKVVEVPNGWLRPHPKQSLDGPDGFRTRQHGSSGLTVDLGRLPRRLFSMERTKRRPEVIHVKPSKGPHKVPRTAYSGERASRLGSAGHST